MIISKILRKENNKKDIKSSRKNSLKEEGSIKNKKSSKEL
jgi:hypothetical protein